MTIRRAKALNAILDHMPLTIHSNDNLAGSMCALIDSPLPEGTSPADYQQAVEEVRAVGERNFRTNSDHYAPDYETLVNEGIGGIRGRVTRRLGENRPAPERDFLQSVLLSLDGVSRFLMRLGEEHRSSGRRPMGDLLDRVATEAPRTFHEATQLIWTFHFIYSLEGRGAMAFGRLDQYLWPFYQRDIASGELTREGAAAILESLWAKLEEPGIPNPIQNIAIGGKTPTGEDATNDVSFLMLEVTGRMKTPASNLSARFHSDTSPEFFEAAAEVIKTGIGFPACFNDDTLVPGLIETGVPAEEANNVCFVGCIETFLPGKMPPWSDSRVNILKALELALHNGFDPVEDVQTGPRTGHLEELSTFDSLKNAFMTQLKGIVARHADEINNSKLCDTTEFTSPLLSALTADCIERGKDINDGGARFADWHGMAGMGLATVTDALAALRKLVYEEQRFPLPHVVAALERDFDGDEVLRQVLLNDAPKYGNGDTATDALAAEVAEAFCRFCMSHETPAQGGKPAGRHVPLLAANVSNIPAGREVGATPDGRRAFTPLSDAASPHFGRDVSGPTAVVRSLTQVDYRNVVGGTVVNTVSYTHLTLPTN